MTRTHRPFATKPRSIATPASGWLAAFLAVAGLAGCSAETVRPDNKPPVLVSLVATPESVVEGQTCTIVATVTDPDGDRLTYEWLPALGYVTGSGREVSYTTTGCCMGANAVQLTVKDGLGGEVVGVASVTVHP